MPTPDDEFHAPLATASPAGAAMRARARRAATDIGTGVLLLSLAVPGLVPRGHPAYLGGAAVLLALFVAIRFPSVDRHLDRWWALPTTALTALLVAGTGGHASPMRIGYLVIASYCAVALERGPFRVAMGVLAMAFLAPLAYDPMTSTYDVTVEFTGHVAVVVVVRLLTQQSARLEHRAEQDRRGLVALFEGSPIPMLTLNRRGRVTRFNAATRAVLPGGVDPDRIDPRSGLSLTPLMPRPDARQVRLAVASALAGHSSTTPLRLRVAGEFRHFEAHIAPVRSPGGRVQQVFTFAQDVTERRRSAMVLAQRSEQRRALSQLGMEALSGLPIEALKRRAADVLHASLPADHASVMIPVDAHLIRIDTSVGVEAHHWEGQTLPTDASLGGWVLRRGVGMASRDLRLESRFPVPDALRQSAIRSGLAAPIRTSAEVWGVLVAGAKEPRAWSEDDVAFVQSVANVVGAAVQRARDADVVATALEDERRVADELRRIDEMRDNFLAAVSHELRTPLTTVLGFSGMLHTRRAELDEEQVATLVERLDANARRLDGLLGDLLDLDRLRRSVVEPVLREVALDELVARVVGTHEAPDGQLYQLVPPMVVRVDPPMLERMVDNLVANALKHGGVDPTVWVRAQTEGADLVLVVEDDGPGIAEDLWETIFEPFEQGDHDHAHSPGTGIGLSLVDRFAALHGGRAWVAGRRGGGAAFHIRLPNAVVGGREDVTGAATPRAQASLRS